MKLIDFVQLQLDEGDGVVWHDEDGYNFTMGDSLLNYGKESEEMEKACEGVEGVKCWVGMGDEIMNCITVQELRTVELVDGLEKFINEYVGSNCYTG